MHAALSYKFCQVFGPDTKQADLYSATAQPLVKGLFEGQNGLIFAYGPTNSGKTYTIQGESSFLSLLAVLAHMFSVYLLY